MKGYATVNVRQYSPDSRVGNFRQQFMYGQLDYYLRCSDLSEDTVYTQIHYPLAQHPSTIRDGAVTTDPDTWSDSQVSQPSLDDGLRYSYGRFGTRYGQLDSHSGAIIRTTDLSVSNDGYTRAINFSGAGDIYRLGHDSTGWVSLEKLSVPSNDVYVYTYNIFSSASPPMFSYKNSVNTDVSIRLANFINSIDQSSLALTLDGVSKSVSVVPFIGGLGGVDVTWTNDTEFDYNAQVNVVWTFTDDAVPSNPFTISYWFRAVKDYIGPRISGLAPADNAVDISVSTCVQFDVRDYEVGVNLDTFELYINNIHIVNDDITFTELSTGDGYRVYYCPSDSFLYGDEIPVSVYVEDSSEEKNYLFHVYSFITESSLAPVFLDSEPAACRKYKPITVDVEADIVDGGHGLDGNSIILHVDDEAVVFRKLPIIYRED